MKSGVSQSKNATILQVRCASALFLLEHVKVQLSPQTHKGDCFACFLFVAATVKFQNLS